MSTHPAKLRWLLLGALAWTLPASAEQLNAMPAPVEWLSGPADNAGTMRTGEGGAVVVLPHTPGPSATNVSVARTGCMPGVETSASDVRALIARVASDEGADAKLADAVAAQESRYDQRRISPKGAIGVMQLTLETARRYRVDPCELESNIRGGVRYLHDLSAEFGGNVMLVLAAYNAGPDRVYAAKGVPPIAETVRYVAAVTNAYYGFENALSTARVQHQAARAEAPAPETANGAVKTTDGNRWIGGSVLYVDQTQGGGQ